MIISTGYRSCQLEHVFGGVNANKDREKDGGIRNDDSLNEKVETPNCVRQISRSHS